MPKGSPSQKTLAPRIGELQNAAKATSAKSAGKHPRASLAAKPTSKLTHIAPPAKQPAEPKAPPITKQATEHKGSPASKPKVSLKPAERAAEPRQPRKAPVAASKQLTKRQIVEPKDEAPVAKSLARRKPKASAVKPADRKAEDSPTELRLEQTLEAQAATPGVEQSLDVTMNAFHGEQEPEAVIAESQVEENLDIPTIALLVEQPQETLLPESPAEPSSPVPALGPAPECQLPTFEFELTVAAPVESPIESCEAVPAQTQAVHNEPATLASRTPSEPKAADLAVKPAPDAELSTGSGELAVEQERADTPAKPLVDRRKASKSLFERRLTDPGAKERRKRALPSETPTDGPIAAAAPRAESEPALEAEADRKAEEPAFQPVVERRVADRRASAREDSDLVEDHFRTREHLNRFNETAIWMRTGGTVLIGVNLLTLIAFFILGRIPATQLKEMQRATAASSEAAYAACLGTQTARNMLQELKAERAQPREWSSGEASQAAGAAHPQAARIALDVEKSTDMNPHIPVLFHFKLQNIGESSALNTKVWGAVKVLDSGKEPDFTYDEVSLTKAAILPGDPAAKVITYTEDAGQVAPLTDAQFERVNSGAAYVVAYGRVVYQDVFGVSHWAQFCRQITKPASAQTQSNKCLAYNAAGDSYRMEKADVQHASWAQNTVQNAAVTLPEIACRVPKDQAN
jgi:hypothetical protein